MSSKSTLISCIILAGGQGKRVGGSDKGLVLYNNKPLIEHVFDVVKPQVDDIVISANRNIETYKRYTANVVGDSTGDYQGPLAGIAACLKHCKHEIILVVACDMPNLPGNLVERLTENKQHHAACIATVNHHHQLAMLIDKNVSTSIQQHLANKQLKLIQWLESLSYCTVSFEGKAEAFKNINHLPD